MFVFYEILIAKYDQIIQIIQSANLIVMYSTIFKEIINLYTIFFSKYTILVI